MAPRTVKAKKNTDVKVSENEPVKKGRGKAKVEPEQDIAEVDEKVVITEKKSKRTKNIVDYNEDIDREVPAKKGRKKNEDTNSDSNTMNGDHSEEDSVPADEQIEEVESNGNSEEIEAPTTKGRKKPAKKEVKPKESGKGKKAKLDKENSNEEEEKPKGRGRNKKAQKPEDSQENEDEDKKEPAKGRKKAQKAPEKLESKEEDEDETESNEQDTEEVEEPKKKGRKNAGKKAVKEDSVDKEVEEPAAKKRKGNKKEEKGKGDTKEDESEEVSEAKPKSKRSKKTEKSEPVSDTGEPAKRRRNDKAAEDKKKPNKSPTDYESIDFSNSSKTAQAKEWNFKISCWNVDGIRAWMGKDGLEYLKYEKPDILCLQEVKCSLEKLPEEVKNIPGYHAYWLCSDKDGYAGVGLYTTKLAINVQYGLQDEELDSEGRIITAEYEQFYLICTYVPNAGRKLVTLPKRLKWNEEFRKYVKSLDEKKPVIICGDMNVAHNEIDLTNPKTNKKNAGFTAEERAGMTKLLGDGFVDIYRHFYPDKTGAYTFWSYMSNSRAKNVGWRLDYFIVSQRLLPSICDTMIRDKVYGSDHCPITLFLHITSADKPKE